MRARFSPTALQNYATCPYKFVLYALHKLARREEPEALEELDALQKGSLVHDILFELHVRLREARLLPVRAETLAESRKHLDAAVAEGRGEAQVRALPGDPARLGRRHRAHQGGSHRVAPPRDHRRRVGAGALRAVVRPARSARAGSGQHEGRRRDRRGPAPARLDRSRRAPRRRRAAGNRLQDGQGAHEGGRRDRRRRGAAAGALRARSWRSSSAGRRSKGDASTTARRSASSKG